MGIQGEPNFKFYNIFPATLSGFFISSILKLTVSMLFTCILRCEQLFMASYGGEDISGRH